MRKVDDVRLDRNIASYYALGAGGASSHLLAFGRR